MLMILMGIPIFVNRLALRKKHPIGTPAVPIAEITEAIKIHKNKVENVASMPLFCIT